MKSILNNLDEINFGIASALFDFNNPYEIDFGIAFALFDFNSTYEIASWFLELLHDLCIGKIEIHQKKNFFRNP